MTSAIESTTQERSDDDLVRIDGVAALAERFGLICDIDGRRLVLPHAWIATESAVRRPGDHGTLAVKASVAAEAGLVPAVAGGARP